MALVNISLHKHHFERNRLHNRAEQYGAPISNYFFFTFSSFFGVFCTFLRVLRKISCDNLKVLHEYIEKYCAILFIKKSIALRLCELLPEIHPYVARTGAKCHTNK